MAVRPHVKDLRNSRLLTEDDVRSRARSQIGRIPFDPYGFPVVVKNDGEHLRQVHTYIRKRGEALFAQTYPGAKGYAHAYGIGLDMAYNWTKADTTAATLPKFTGVEDGEIDHNKMAVVKDGRNYETWLKAFNAGRLDGLRLKQYHIKFRASGVYPVIKPSAILEKGLTLEASDPESDLRAYPEMQYWPILAKTDFYGAWITDKGEILKVDHESSHARAFRIYMSHSKEMTDAFKAIFPKQEYGNIYTFAFSLGWINIASGGPHCHISFFGKSVAPRAAAKLPSFLKKAAEFKSFAVTLTQPNPDDTTLENFDGAAERKVIDLVRQNIKVSTLMGSLEIVYHATSLYNLVSMLTQKRIKLSTTLGTSSDRSTNTRPFFMSLTRTRVGGYHTRATGHGQCLMELDYDYLKSRYRIEPRDYWGPEFRKADQTMNEMEETLTTDKAFIPLTKPAALIKNIDILWTETEDDRGSNATLRSLLIMLKKLGISFRIYDNKNAWMTGSLKQVPLAGLIPRLKGQERTGYSRGKRNYFAEYMELMNVPDRNKLSKRAARTLSDLEYEYDFDQVMRRLTNELHNSRRDDTAVPIVQAIGKAGGMKPFLEGLRDRFKGQKITAAERYPYGYWITHDGVRIPVSHEDHARTARAEMRKHYPEADKTIQSRHPGDERPPAYEYADYAIFQLGWVRLVNETADPKNTMLEVELSYGNLAPQAYESLVRYVNDMPFSVYYLIAKGKTTVESAPVKSGLIETPKTLLHAIRKCMKREMVAASVESGAWVTHEGITIPVPDEKHAEIARKWVAANKLQGQVVQGFGSDDYNAYDYVVQNLGWVRVTVDGPKCEVNFYSGRLSLQAYQVIARYLRTSAFTDILVIAASRLPQNFAYATFTKPQDALQMMYKNILSNNMTAMVESAEQTLQGSLDLTDQMGRSLVTLLDPTPRTLIAFLKRTSKQKLRGWILEDHTILWWDAEKAVHVFVAKQLPFRPDLSNRLEAFVVGGRVVIDYAVYGALREKAFARLVKSNDIAFLNKPKGWTSGPEYLTTTADNTDVDLEAADASETMTFTKTGSEKGRDFTGRYTLDQYDIGFGTEKVRMSVKRYAQTFDAKVNIFGNSANKFGPKNVRTMLAFIKKKYKNVYVVYGDRISGARLKSGKLLNSARVVIRRDPTPVANLTAEEITARSQFAGQAYLIPAVRINNKLYKAHVGSTSHGDALKKIADPALQRLVGGDFNAKGFVNDRNQYMSRARAQKYALEHGLYSKMAPSWVAQQSELVADFLRTPEEWRDMGFGQIDPASGQLVASDAEPPFRVEKVLDTYYKVYMGPDQAFGNIKKKGREWDAELRNKHGDLIELAGLWNKRSDAIEEVQRLLVRRYVEPKPLEGSDMPKTPAERVAQILEAAEAQSYTNKSKQVKLIFYKNRSTAQTCKPGQTVRPKAGYGPRTKVRNATAEETAQLKKGVWLRTREDGAKATDKGAKKTQYRPWLTASDAMERAVKEILG